MSISIDRKAIRFNNDNRGVNAFWKDLIDQRGVIFFFRQLIRGIKLVTRRRNDD